MATKIQVRRDAAADWTSTNPTLAAGEIGFESDTNKFKIGDGATAWTSLNYAPEGYLTETGLGDLTVTGSTIQSPSNAAITLDPSGTGTIELNANTNVTGSLTTTTSLGNDAITINDNKITASRTNDDLEITASGTGMITLGGTVDGLGQNEKYGVVLFYEETVDASTQTTVDDQRQVHSAKANFTLSGSSTDADATYRQQIGNVFLDVNGNSITGSSTPNYDSGAYNKISTTLSNNGGTAGTIGESSGVQTGVDLFSFGGSTLTVNRLIGNQAYFNANSNVTVTDGYGFRTHANTGGGGTITDFYGFYVDTSGNDATNTYAFYDNTNSLSVFGDVQTQGVSIIDNTISSNRSNDNLLISASGTGKVSISGLNYPTTDGTSGQVLTTDGSGNLSFSTVSGGGASTGDITFTGSTIQSPSNAALTLDPSGTGTIELNANTNVTGSLTATTSISNDAISIDDNIISGIRSNDNIILRPNGFGIVEIQGPGGTSTNLNMNGGVIANVTTGSSSGDLATRGFVETGTATLFNKSISADNNTLSDIEVDNFKASAIVIESEGIASNDNDTTIPTSAAVKDYVDNAGGGASTGDITFTGSTIQSPSNANLTLDPSGTGTIELNANTNVTGSLTATTSISNDAISIDDNVLKTTRSNDNLLITANGTGYVVIGDTAANAESNVDINERYGVINVYRETVDASTMTTFNDHRRANTTKSLYTLSAGTSDNNAIFQQNLAYTLLDLNGYSLTGSFTPDFGSGASNKISTTLTNNGASASSIAESHGMFNQVDHFSFGGSTLTSTNTVGNGVYINAYPNTTVTNAYGVRTYANTVDFGSGPGTITNFYGFYIHDTSNNATNQYGFWDTTNSLSRFGAVRLDNQASDPSGVADASHIYAKDVSSSSEVFVRDEAGNVTQISPHNEQGEWQYYSVNEKTGKTVRVNMEKMIRKLEAITGETFIENE